MTRAYGEEFSRIYSAKWDLWGRMTWPFLARTLKHHCPSAHSWLDLCCGSGGLLKLAGEHGYEAVGVDQSRHQLSHARKKAPSAQLIEGDVCSLSLRRTFDVVTCLFDSLNYLLTLRDLSSALGAARRHLSPGGVLCFDVKTAEGFRNERMKVFHGSEHTVLFESAYDERTARHSFRVTGFVADGEYYRRFAEEHAQRAYTQEAIERIVRRNSLTYHVYDGETFGRARARSRRLCYVASLVDDAGALRRATKHGTVADNSGGKE